MTDQVVLLADNIVEFLETRAHILRKSNYIVITAAGLPEAERVLRERRIHVAILDLRLIDDKKEQDISGLLLAQSGEFRLVPKIILTGYPSFEAVRSALGSLTTGLSPAVTFITKAEGPAIMLAAVERAMMGQVVGINWKLKIEPQRRSLVSLQVLADAIDPQDDRERSSERAEELGDVLRKLFRNSSQLTFGCILWHRDGRVVVTASMFDDEGHERPVVVKLGLRRALAEESSRLAPYRQAAAGQGFEAIEYQETMRYGGCTLAQGRGDVETVRTLRAFWETQPPREIIAAVEHIFDHALKPWRDVAHMAGDRTDLAELLRGQLRITVSGLVDQLPQRIQLIDQKARSLNLGGVTLTGDGLKIQFPLRDALVYPDPRPLLAGAFENGDSAALQIGGTVGSLDADTILVDEAGKAWPSDFARVATGPLVSDYAALEATVKFELLKGDDMFERHVLERVLSMPTRLDGRLEAGEMPDAPSKTLAVKVLEGKALNVIRRIRQLAAAACGSDARTYYLALFFCTAERITRMDPQVHLSREELASLLHAAISLGILAGRLSGPWQAHEGELFVDTGKRVARVGSREIELSRIEFDLLAHLWAHRGEWCERSALYKAAYPGIYDPVKDDAALNMMMSRLRQSIEADPDKRLINTRRGGGYRLEPPETG